MKVENWIKSSMASIQDRSASSPFACLCIHASALTLAESTNNSSKTRALAFQSCPFLRYANELSSPPGWGCVFVCLTLCGLLASWAFTRDDLDLATMDIWSALLSASRVVHSHTFEYQISCLKANLCNAHHRTYLGLLGFKRLCILIFFRGNTGIRIGQFLLSFRFVCFVVSLSIVKHLKMSIN